jgi:hypothetical protein
VFGFSSVLDIAVVLAFSYPWSSVVPLLVALTTSFLGLNLEKFAWGINALPRDDRWQGGLSRNGLLANVGHELNQASRFG